MTEQEQKYYYALGQQLFELSPGYNINVNDISLLDINPDEIFRGGYYETDEIHNEDVQQRGYMNKFFLAGFNHERNEFLENIPEHIKEIKLGDMVLKR